MLPRGNDPSTGGDLVELHVSVSERPYVSEAIDLKRYTHWTLFTKAIEPEASSAVISVYGIETAGSCPDHAAGDTELGRLTSVSSSWSRWDHDAHSCFLRIVVLQPLPGNGTPASNVDVLLYLSGQAAGPQSNIPSPSPGLGSPTTATAPVPSPSPATPPAVSHDLPHYFSSTRFRVDDQLWGYFVSRGGESTFGPPISRTFTLLGCGTQIFQRQAVQMCAGEPPRTMNLLDSDLFPYTQVNGSHFPPPDAGLKISTPRVEDSDYGAAVMTFVRENTTDTFDAQPVNFQKTFFGTVKPESSGTSDPNILSLLALDYWGVPISRPQYEPDNHKFIYQRFQRGIMHYLADQSTTSSILLADYFKQILLGPQLAGEYLPPDLAAQATQSRFFQQYCPASRAWLCRPDELPATDLTFAFEPS
jgi:hypothetical protein